MPNQFTKTTFTETYKDDWRDSDNYYRILFNSARPLQARELTQLQTISQNQVTKFAKSIYKEGSPVIAGGLTLQFKQFVKLQDASVSFSVGDVITGSTSQVQAVVIDVLPRIDQDNPTTIYVKYTNNGLITSGATSVTFTAGEVITSGLNSATIQSINTIINPAFGFGTFASINSSTYFIKGFFIQVNDQSIVVDRYIDYPNTKLGFIMNEDIVTATDNDALYDNQNDLPNYTAPGADRYRITATLSSIDDIDSADDFFPISIVQNGNFVYDPTDPTYSIIGDVMAERTREESGNYIVSGYTSHLEQGESDGVLLLHVEPGIAYVNGYRIERLTQTIMPVKKSRTTTEVNNEQIAASFGNYLRVDGTTLKGLPNIAEYEEYSLRDDSSYGGSTIGTAKVRSIIQESGDYRLHLIDVQMNVGESFRSVKSLGTSANKYANTILENNIAVIHDAYNNNAFFEFPYTRPQSISDISFTAQRYFTSTTDGSGEATLTLTETSESFADTTSWIVASRNDGTIYSASISGAGSQSATISISATNEPIEIIAYVGKSQSQVKTKTLVEDVVVNGNLVESDGTVYLPLNQTDIFRIKSIYNGTSEVSQSFSLDDGQRDNFYDYGKIILRDNTMSAGENLTATFDYFSHGATGDFFAVNSYIGQVEYDQIPAFRQQNGEIVQLRNVLDFRSVKNSSGNFGSGAIVFELPVNTDLITLDTIYYNKRRDLLSISDDNTLIYTPGTPSLTPAYPIPTSDTLNIKRYALSGYTDNEKDTVSVYVDNRRFTMRDIAGLERRINELEESVTLNMLELEASTLEVLDADGLNRFKTGLFADNFKNLNFTDALNPSHTASINVSVGEVLPAYIERIVELEYDSDASTSVRRGNYIMNEYTEELFETQVMASEAQNLNPYAIIVKEGFLELNPKEDTWKVEKTITDQIIRNAPLYSNNNNTGNFTTGSGFDLAVGDIYSSSSAERSKIFTSGDTEGYTFGSTSKQISSVKNTYNQRIEESISFEYEDLPYVRHRKVFFRATGLKPDHRYFLFMGGVDITSYARDEAEDKILPSFYGANENKYTDEKYAAYTTHPETSTELYSDAQGVIVGSFFVPANEEIKFEAGEKTILLTDVSTADLDQSTSYATTTYKATGQLVTKIITQYIYNIPQSSPTRSSYQQDERSYYKVSKISGRIYYSSTAATNSNFYSNAYDTYYAAKKDPNYNNPTTTYEQASKSNK